MNVWPCATGASRKQIATRVDFYAHSYNEGRIAAALDLVRPIDKMILRIASSMHSYGAMHKGIPLIHKNRE